MVALRRQPTATRRRTAGEGGVRRAGRAGARVGALVWDLGANTGEFCRLAARPRDYVVAMDGDQLAVDRLYQALRAENVTNVLPLVVDSRPFAGLGWRDRERRDASPSGARPDLVLASRARSPPGDLEQHSGRFAAGVACGARRSSGRRVRLEAGRHGAEAAARQARQLRRLGEAGFEAELEARFEVARASSARVGNPLSLLRRSRSRRAS